MNTFIQTDELRAWLNKMRDFKAKARVLSRLRRATFGNFGDCASVGDGVYEMRIHFGPGYRIYYMRMEETVYLLLAGGDKSSQSSDIDRAKRAARELKAAKP